MLTLIRCVRSSPTTVQASNSAQRALPTIVAISTMCGGIAARSNLCEQELNLLGYEVVICGDAVEIRFSN